MLYPRQAVLVPRKKKRFRARARPFPQGELRQPGY